MAYLEVQHVRKAFPAMQRGTPSHTLALDDLNVEMEQGKFYCLLGASGCGKSTLLRIIDGLIAPDAGQVILNGQPVRHPGPDRGMVFQQFNLLPWRTVLGNVSYGLEMLGVPSRIRRERAMNYLNMTGLNGFEHYYPAQLSGGMQQRVGLARALVIEPQLLLLDEPFGSLDELTREALQLELLRLWALRQQTIIFVTHDISEAVFLADQILIMSSRPGKIAATIEITLPRPRHDDLRSTLAYAELRRQIALLLKAASEPQ